MTYCIWDLDSTLCDTRHRRHLMPPREEWSFPGAWDKFSEACVDDEPIIPIIRLYQSLLQSYQPFILSARSGSPLVYTRTRGWLSKHGVYRFDHLILKPAGLDHISPSEWKKSVVKNSLDMGYQIDLAIDDHPGIGEIFTELGIPTVIVTPPGLHVEFDKIPHV